MSTIDTRREQMFPRLRRQKSIGFAVSGKFGTMPPVTRCS
jgi:hypothetical protein